MARLRRSDPAAPGITRHPLDDGFAYRAPDGRPIDAADVLARIEALVIPPAWTDVWIAPWPNGHIQAMGTDARGRRQYRYHDDWRSRRDAEKFRHMTAFAATLGPLRTVVAEHLGRDDMSRERILGCAVRLLDVGCFRIGSEGYAEQNNSFGLATMRKAHVRLDGDTATFDYIAKSGKRRIQTVVDAEAAEVVRALKRRRGGGRELLAYKERGRWRDVRSTDINAYLKAHTGEDVTAKDFRTWHATVLCAVGLALAEPPRTATARRRAVTTAVKGVAEYLGNTPAVCRGSYVDPRVIDRFQAGATIATVLAELPPSIGQGPATVMSATDRSRIEAAVIDLIDAAATTPSSGRSAA